MVRTFAMISVLCLLLAGVFAVQKSPLDTASQKAAADAALLSDLAGQPNRVSWRLSEDLALKRVMIWTKQGHQQYPPQDVLVPLIYEFSEDTTRMLTQKQQATNGTEWSWFDTAQSELIHCRQDPAICLIYDRALLEDVLELQDGALTLANHKRIGLIASALLGLLFLAASFLLSKRPHPESPISDPTTTLEIIAERHVARRGALEVPLTPRDLKLLRALEQRDGAVVTKDELYDAGWGRDYMPNSRALDQHMITLRRKLDPDHSMPAVIETVRGVGYRLLM
ncbi:MAG: winged helix-turn-helix domain-containing protein [Pseudomonadota bacterium]